MGSMPLPFHTQGRDKPINKYFHIATARLSVCIPKVSVPMVHNSNNLNCSSEHCIRIKTVRTFKLDPWNLETPKHPSTYTLKKSSGDIHGKRLLWAETFEKNPRVQPASGKKFCRLLELPRGFGQKRLPAVDLLGIQPPARSREISQQFVETT